MMAEPKRTSEQRKGTRATIRARVDYEIESEDTFLYEYMTNLSHAGIFLATHNPLPVGTVTRLRFTLPGEGEVAVKGRVAWINAYRPGRSNPNPGMGVEFLDLSENHKDKIVRIVKRLAILAD
jgi:type IV pilus assembly protein PilZ